MRGVLMGGWPMKLESVQPWSSERMMTTLGLAATTRDVKLTTSRTSRQRTSDMGATPSEWRSGRLRAVCRVGVVAAISQSAVGELTSRPVAGRVAIPGFSETSLYAWRDAVRFTLFTACLAVAQLLIASRAEAAPPNFVIVFLDDVGYSDIGCFGSK